MTIDEPGRVGDDFERSKDQLEIDWPKPPPSWWGHVTDWPKLRKSEQIMADVDGTDEPVFVFRAQDIFSVMVLARYLEIVEAYGPDDHEHQRGIAEALADFKSWQRRNLTKVRYPD